VCGRRSRAGTRALGCSRFPYGPRRTNHSRLTWRVRNSAGCCPAFFSAAKVPGVATIWPKLKAGCLLSCCIGKTPFVGFVFASQRHRRERGIKSKCPSWRRAWPSALSRARSLRLSERSGRPFYEKGARCQSSFAPMRAMRRHFFHGGRGAPGISGRVKAARSAPRNGCRALTRPRRVRELPARKECSYLLVLEGRMVDVYQSFWWWISLTFSILSGI